MYAVCIAWTTLPPSSATLKRKLKCRTLTLQPCPNCFITCSSINTPGTIFCCLWRLHTAYRCIDLSSCSHAAFRTLEHLIYPRPSHSTPSFRVVWRRHIASVHQVRSNTKSYQCTTRSRQELKNGSKEVRGPRRQRRLIASIFKGGDEIYPYGPSLFRYAAQRRPGQERKGSASL